MDYRTLRRSIRLMNLSFTEEYETNLKSGDIELYNYFQDIKENYTLEKSYNWYIIEYGFFTLFQIIHRNNLIQEIYSLQDFSNKIDNIENKTSSYEDTIRELMLDFLKLELNIEVGKPMTS